MDTGGDSGARYATDNGLAIIPWSLGEIVDGSSELDANAHASDNGESDGSNRT